MPSLWSRSTGRITGATRDHRYPVSLFDSQLERKAIFYTHTAVLTPIQHIYGTVGEYAIHIKYKRSDLLKPV